MIFWARSSLWARNGLDDDLSSWLEFIRLEDLCCGSTPPILLRLRFWLSSMPPRTSVNSCSAAGCTPLVAIRSTTSLQLVVEQFEDIGCLVALKVHGRMVAMIQVLHCGSAPETIEVGRVEASIPECRWFPRISSIRLEARLLPSVLASTERDMAARVQTDGRIASGLIVKIANDPPHFKATPDRGSPSPADLCTSWARAEDLGSAISLGCFAGWVICGRAPLILLVSVLAMLVHPASG